VEHATDLAAVIGHLRKKDRLTFVNMNLGCIKTWPQMGKILHTLPTEDRSDLLNNHDLTLNRLEDLCAIAIYLAPDIAINFIEKYANVITESSDLESVLRFLPKESRLNAAMLQQHKIDKAESLLRILTWLNSADRTSFALANLEALPFRGCKDYPNNGGYIWDLIGLLPVEEVLKFATQFPEETMWRSVHYYLLVALPMSLREEFARAKSQALLAERPLCVILACLDEDKRYQYVQDCDWIISTIRELLSILEQLPKPVRLQYVLKHQDTVKTWGDFFTILEHLPRPERLVFAERFPHFFNDTTSKEILLNFLDQNERLTFLLSHVSEIKTTKEYSRLSECLAGDRKVTFSHRYLEQQAKAQLVAYDAGLFATRKTSMQPMPTQRQKPDRNHRK
jgi:hypothetical protein